MAENKPSVNAKQFTRPDSPSGPGRCESGHGRQCSRAQSRRAVALSTRISSGCESRRERQFQMRGGEIGGRNNPRRDFGFWPPTAAPCISFRSQGVRVVHLSVRRRGFVVQVHVRAPVLPLCLSSHRAGFVYPYSSVRVRPEAPFQIRIVV